MNATLTTMRIIAGEAGGRLIKAPGSKGTRPTDSRSREALFNILGARVAGARVLDLYAGTGALGLEALSRGAQSCIMVEQNALACRSIRQNVRELGWTDRVQIWEANVKSALRRLLEQPVATSEPFDLILADPPWHRAAELPDLCLRLDKAHRLLDNVDERSAGALVIQHHRKARPALSPPWLLVQERVAGESILSFFELAALPVEQ